MKHLYAAVILTCCLSLTAAAQNTAPTHTVDGQYITEWLLLGPFVPDNLSTDFLAEAGGEASSHPQNAGFGERVGSRRTP